jgi:hypothetical protein
MRQVANEVSIMRLLSRTLKHSEKDSAQFQYQRGLDDLGRQKRRSAQNHFQRAVEIEPHLAIAIAQQCLKANQPRVAIRICAQAQHKLGLELAAPRQALCATAHHNLSHDRWRGFREKHNQLEIENLEGVFNMLSRPERGQDRPEIEKLTEAMAERYAHTKFGVCYSYLACSDVSKPSGHENEALFVDLISMCIFRLDRDGDSALSMMDNLFFRGPQKSLRFRSMSRRLRACLDAYIQRAPSPTQKSKAESILRRISLPVVD